MYGKFVGLDIGSSTVKITLIKRGLRGTEILETVQLKSSESEITPTEITPTAIGTNSSEIKTTRGEGRGFNAAEGIVTTERPVQETVSSPKLISATPGELFIESGFPRSDVATSPLDIPISIRLLKFPFHDPAKIDQVYEFELENVSPFDPRDKVHGYHLIRAAEGSEVLVCMFEKEHVKHLIDICEKWEVDPKVVTFAPVASSALSGFLPKERPLVLINIGASKMTFSLIDEGGLRRVRASSKAGNLITESLSRNLRVSFEEAEYVKLNRLGDIDTKVLGGVISPVFDEVKKTIQFFEMEIKSKVETVLLSGGTSLMPGIEDYLGREINKDVRKLFIPDLGDEKSPIFSDSFALALYGSTFRKGSLNLRKGEFKYVGRDEELRSTFKIPAVLLALLILLSLYRSGERYFELRDRAENLEAQVEREVRETFPDVKVIPRPVIFLENEVKEVRDQLTLFQGIRGGSTPLDVLKNISAGIPQGKNVTVEEVAFMDDKTVRLVGKSSSYEEVSGIEKALSDMQMFERVVIDSTDTALNNSIEFQMTVVLK